MQYMVVQAQYVGRITDDLDREIFITYGNHWVQETIFQPTYCFNNLITDLTYQIPDTIEHVRFLEYISTMPGKDSPPIFGLHPNADLTSRLKESLEIITTLVDTQPKDFGGGSGKSREEEVKEKIEKELLVQLPQTSSLSMSMRDLSILRDQEVLVTQRLFH